MTGAARAFVVGAGLVAALAAPARAHRLNVEARVEAGRVRVEVYFSDGATPAGAEVVVTRDGVEVRMTLSVLWRIDDVDRAAAQSDPRLVVAEAVERSVRHEVGALDLRSLLEDREGMLGRLTGDQTGLLAATGVCLLDADLLATEIRVGPHLLDLLSVTATCRPT